MKIEEEFINMISEQSRIDKSKINSESTLLGDLKVDGDDAWEILELCEEKYGIDLADFDFHSYFRNEPCYKGITYLYRKWKYKDEHVASKKTPITIFELYNLCINRKQNNGI